MRLKEFKVIITSHQRAALAYAIVVSVYMTAEPDAKPGVYLDKHDDMFIIAYNFQEASWKLNEKIHGNGVVTVKLNK